MRIISEKKLKTYWKSHADCESALRAWIRVVRTSEWKDHNELAITYPSASRVGRLVVFNIGGNKHRLITAIHFHGGRVYIRNVMTHKEYDRGEWKQG
jgi:mRNA interferase HigB